MLSKTGPAPRHCSTEHGNSQQVLGIQHFFNDALMTHKWSAALHIQFCVITSESPKCLVVCDTHLSHHWRYRCHHLVRHGSCWTWARGCCRFWSTHQPWRYQRSHCTRWPQDLRCRPECPHSAHPRSCSSWSEGCCQFWEKIGKKQGVVSDNYQMHTQILVNLYNK